jgi:transcription termination factor Rho
MCKTVDGVFQRLPQGGGFLRDAKRSFQASSDDIWVSTKLIKQFSIIDGAVVQGTGRQSDRGWQLTDVESICGMPPGQFHARPRFAKLLAIDPLERLRLGDNGNVSMRIIALIAPIGKGTRGLIVAPPKTGKTRILEEIACAIHASEPEIRIVVLLIDERPEEVTHFRRSVEAEVLASSNDQSTESHVNLAELTLAHIRCELECGRDVVVLMDSITRLARAFNRYGAGSSRTMTGGLDSKALEIPRKFFGLARNIEDGGSVTVIATALIDTGSRMDDFIFEEFKGTGNSELVLDRDLSDIRVFPAIDLKASSTRKEELLYDEDETEWLARLRRLIASADTKGAMLGMLKLIDETESNAQLFKMASPGW